MDWSTALVSLRAAAGVAGKAGQLPLQSQLLEMHEKLFDLVAKQAELVTEKSELAAKVETLSGLLQLREGFHHERNAYWKRHGDHVDGPFCSTCFDSDGKAIRLIEKNVGYGICGVCKNLVPLAGPRPIPGPPQRRVISPGWVRGWER